MFRSVQIQSTPDHGILASATSDEGNPAQSKEGLSRFEESEGNDPSGDDDSRPVWAVAYLTPVPLFHEIPWNTLTVQHLDLQTLTHRIAEYLRLHSIDALFHDEGRACCTTLNRAQFVIQLWQGPTPGETIVEFQRTGGDSFEAQRHRMGLYESIRQDSIVLDPPEPSHPKSMGLQKQIETILSVSSTFRDSNGEATKDVYESSPLELALQMLQSPYSCQQKLGLESLVALTDPQTTFWSQVRATSHHVVHDERIHKCLQKHLVEPTNSTACHFLTLKIMGNALASASEVQVDSPFWNQVALPMWESHIYLHSTRPLEACLSARCLRLWNERCSKSVNNPALEAVVRRAHQQGCRLNLSLERETRGLLEGMGVPVV